MQILSKEFDAKMQKWRIHFFWKFLDVFSSKLVLIYGHYVQSLRSASDFEFRIEVNEYQLVEDISA